MAYRQPYRVTNNLRCKVRDGTLLSTDLYIPIIPAHGTESQQGLKFPAMLIRTPYGKDSKMIEFYPEVDFFAKNGFLVVVQDCRGRFDSEGSFYPFVHEAEDGYDAVEWVAQLPECNGYVGTMGQSYMGATQVTLASLKPPHLKCCLITSPFYPNLYTGTLCRNGIPELTWQMIYWAVMSHQELQRRGIANPDRYLDLLDKPWWFNVFRIAAGAFGWKGLAEISPLSFSKVKKDVVQSNLEEIVEMYAKEDVIAFTKDFMEHPYYDDFWKNVEKYTAPLAIPTFFTTGWYDAFLHNTVELCTQMSPSIPCKLVIAPIGHVFAFTKPASNSCGELNTGDPGKMDLLGMHLEFAKKYVCEQKPVEGEAAAGSSMMAYFWSKKEPVTEKRKAEEDKKARVFVIGSNKWIDLETFPLKADLIVKKSFHLASRGNAKSSKGNGRLFEIYPRESADGIIIGDEEAEYDELIYKYDDPVPTRGGATVGYPDEMGMRDQRSVETRNDVLVFSSPHLDYDFTILGKITVYLYAKTPLTDIDFAVKLVDVAPNRSAVNISDGITRASLRNPKSKSPVSVKPNEVIEYVIDLWYQGYTMQKGHRLRLDIACSNFPRYPRNEAVLLTEARQALQTIMHSKTYPSRVELDTLKHHVHRDH